MRKRTKKNDGPLCQFCGATKNAPFNLFGKFEFGTCCVDCEALSDEERELVKWKLVADEDGRTR